MPKIAQSLLVSVVMLLSIAAFAVDGVVLINQATVMSNGGHFPYTITQPGSYRLTGNLTLPDANTTAIVISQNDVTLDLNGFAIEGPNVCQGGSGNCSAFGNGNGIHIGAFTNVRITNGSVNGVGSNGIDTDVNSVVVVDRVSIRNAGFNGISLDQGTVSNSKVENVFNIGIGCVTGCAVESTYLLHNFDGIFSSGFLRARDNTVTNNAEFGMSFTIGLLIGNSLDGNGTSLSGAPAVNSNNVCNGGLC